MSPKIYYYETARLFDRNCTYYDAGLPLLSLAMTTQILIVCMGMQHHPHAL